MKNLFFQAGDIFAVFGVDCASGDTFVVDQKYTNLSMESMFVPEPVVSMSISPKEHKDRERFAKAIDRFTREDPTFQYYFDVDSKESIVSGMGELHLEIYAQRMEREYQCPVTLGKPKVAFRETLLDPVEFNYLHKKQSGGQGQFARIIGTLEPLPAEENTQVKFSDKTVGTNVPKQYIPGVKRGFLDMCDKGLLTGNKIAGVHFQLFDGAAHIVDSSEFAFFLAAQGAMRDCFDMGKWRILEPIMSVEVVAPMEFQATVLTGVSKRNGIVTQREQTEGWFTAYAEVPLNKMFGYATELR